jgi:hypothetical protein
MESEELEELSATARRELLELILEQVRSGPEAHTPETIASLARAWASLRGMPKVPELPAMPFDLKPPTRLGRALFGGPVPKSEQQGAAED